MSSAYKLYVNCCYFRSNYGHMSHSAIQISLLMLYTEARSFLYRPTKDVSIFLFSYSSLFPAKGPEAANRIESVMNGSSFPCFMSVVVFHYREEYLGHTSIRIRAKLASLGPSTMVSQSFMWWKSWQDFSCHHQWESCVFSMTYQNGDLIQAFRIFLTMLFKHFWI